MSKRRYAKANMPIKIALEPELEPERKAYPL
jgi:hypothetical protein